MVTNYFKNPEHLSSIIFGSLVLFSTISSMPKNYASREKIHTK